jgi:hypothetical protein
LPERRRWSIFAIAQRKRMGPNSLLDAFSKTRTLPGAFRLAPRGLPCLSKPSNSDFDVLQLWRDGVLAKALR